MNRIVLAIDDSLDSHLLLAARLRREEIDLHHACDGESGLAKAIELQPDLILLDVVMPSMSGFEICKRIKEDPRTKDVAIIFLTGTSDRENRIQGLDLGAVDYVTKPFDPAELCARVRSALRAKRYQDILSKRAHIDALTGLWNRGTFDRRLAEEMAGMRRYGRDVSLIMVDIDHFRLHNTEFGHTFGDRVLQDIGQLLHMSLRETDVPCRYGGEEFGIILTETSSEGASVLAERLRQEIAGLTFQGQTVPTRVTASFGVASASDLHDLSPTTLLKKADDALYQSKTLGRDRVCTHSPTGILERPPGLELFLMKQA